MINYNVFHCLLSFSVFVCSVLLLLLWALLSEMNKSMENANKELMVIMCAACDPYCSGTCTYANSATSCDACASDEVSVTRKPDGTCVG